MGSSLVGVAINGIGGFSRTLNVTAAALIKSNPGYMYRIIVSSVGSGSGALTLNDSSFLTGPNTITAITAAAQAVITISTGGASNPYVVGQPIVVTGAGGMTQINGLVGTVTAVGGVTTAWTITTSINSTAFSAFTSAGTCASYGAGNQIITLPFGNMTVGQVIAVEVPLTTGLIVSAVPGAGSPQYTLTWT